MQIILAKHAGFCFGVKRAVLLILLGRHAMRADEHLRAFGHLLHTLHGSDALLPQIFHKLLIVD